ncbi:hypothetical protein SUGI_0681330 [Cryptomeria japonica]|nr:hypothetical protein SUGI_0681330 [Cryptomeria japonica]
MLKNYLRGKSSIPIFTEEKYSIVEVNTFLIEEGTDFDASTNSTSKETAPEELGREEANLAINHLNVASNSSWRDMLMHGLERDKYFVNRLFSHDSNSNNVTSSPSVGNYYIIPVRSGREIQGPEYTVAASIGTPARKQLMGIDTLISVSWIQCNPCKGCISNVNFPMYVPKQSSS